MALAIDEGHAMVPKTRSLRMRFTSDPQARYCTRVVFFLAFFSVTATACSSLEPYRLPEDINNIATIEDKEPRIGSHNFVRVMSIDRKRIDSKSRGIPPSSLDESTNALGKSEDWIPLRAGLRKLEVQVCKYSPGILEVLFLSGWYCGHAVLPLVVEPRAHYRLCGSVNKQEDYAELWIEDAELQKTIVEVIRVPIEDW